MIKAADFFGSAITFPISGGSTAFGTGQSFASDVSGRFETDR